KCVVESEETTAPQELERPFVVLERAFLVGVDENEVERSTRAALEECVERIEREADTKIDLFLYARFVPVAARHARPLFAAIAGDDAPVEGHRQRDGERAIAREHADL